MELEYIDFNYKPNKNDLVAEYHVEPRRISIEEACENIAAESSIGTWTELSTMNKGVADRLKPTVFSINKNEIKIAYPSELFEAGNMPQIYSAIAGNIFGMKVLKNLRLQDVSFPWEIMKKFKGPKFGIKGVRRLFRKKKRPLIGATISAARRPLIGTIVKPKVGLNAKQHAKVAYDSWYGGLDIVKDDENLTNMKFNKFEDRVKETLRRRDKVEIETGEKKIYMPNVTAETNEMLRRAKYVKKLGGEYIMIDIITAGWAGLQTLREADLGMVIHAHRAMHGAFTENPRHGISMLTIAKTARLIGVDQIHVGAIVGKMKGGKEEVQMIGEEIEDRIIHPDKDAHVLEQKWYNVKPVFAVCSGGLYPGAIPPLVKAMGNNIIIQGGGGVHGHPDGTFYGARAMRQAIEAVMKKIPLKAYAEHYIELNKALMKWGVRT